MIKKLFKTLIVAPLACALSIVLFFGLFYFWNQLIFTPDFFETSEEIVWVRETSSGEIDFYSVPWAKQSTLTISEEKSLYVSPQKKYILSLIHLKENNEGGVIGFIITDVETGKVALRSPHWVIHPSEVKWLFNEKYVVYTYSEKDMIGLQREYVYVGSLKTGEIAKLTTTKPYQAVTSN